MAEQEVAPVGINVKVYRLMGIVTEVNLKQGATIADAIKIAKVDTKDCKVTLRGEDAGLDEKVWNGDEIVLVPKMVGGC
jgi:molybdopterin converting factor small subunit